MDNRWVQFSYFSHAHIQLFWIKAAKLENQSLSNVAVNKNKGCAHDSKHYTQKILILDILQIPCYLIFQEQLSASFRFVARHGMELKRAKARLAITFSIWKYLADLLSIRVCDP